MTEKLRDTQVTFYQKTYGKRLSLIERTYEELIQCCDLEGIQWFRSNVNKLGRQARLKAKKLHDDISAG